MPKLASVVVAVALAAAAVSVRADEPSEADLPGAVAHARAGLAEPWGRPFRDRLAAALTEVEGTDLARVASGARALLTLSPDHRPAGAAFTGVWPPLAVRLFRLVTTYPGPDATLAGDALDAAVAVLLRGGTPARGGKIPGTYLIEVAKGGASAARLAALRRLAVTPVRSDWLAGLAFLLADPDAAVRAAACEALARGGASLADRDVAPWADVFLRDIRRAPIPADARPAARLGAVLAEVRDETWGALYASAFLGGLEARDQVPALLDAVRRLADPEVRQTLLGLAWRLDGEITRPVVDGMLQPSAPADDRYVAAIVLVGIARLPWSPPAIRMHDGQPLDPALVARTRADYVAKVAAWWAANRTLPREQWKVPQPDGPRPGTAGATDRPQR